MSANETIGEAKQGSPIRVAAPLDTETEVIQRDCAMAQRSVLVLGDSTLDNGAYVGLLGRSLKSHLKELLEDWTIDFRALDGAVCADVSQNQLRGEAGDFDAVVVSVGGNDALGHLHLLEDTERRRLIEHGLMLADIQDTFRADYRQVLDAADGDGCPILVLTIYRARFHLDGMPADLGRAANALLSLFNDVIQEEGLARRHDILDVRHICVSDEHFANAIEPSDSGGREIAMGIKQWIDGLGRYGDTG